MSASRLSLYRRAILAGSLIAGLVTMPAFAGTFTTVYAFTGKADGATPRSGVVMDAQGNMYGVATYGGVQCYPSTYETGCGTLFKIDPAGNETTLVTFNGSNGENPGSPLTLIGNRLYGSAGSGSSTAYAGLLFSVNTDGSSFKVLHQFNGYDGYEPTGALRVMPNGTIYGTTYGGGPGWCPTGCELGGGVLFKVLPDGTYSMLHNFDPLISHNQDQPGQIFVAPTGVIYGVTSGSNQYYRKNSVPGGAIYSFNPPTGSFRVLYNFRSRQDGAVPQIGGFIGQSLFGATQYDGPGGYGTLFQLGAGGLTTLYSFTEATGYIPNQPSITSAGQIVGATEDGGFQGTLYSFANGQLTTLYDFVYADGAMSSPRGPLTVTSTGALIGTAESTTLTYPAECTLSDGKPVSGVTGCGAVFRYNP